MLFVNQNSLIQRFFYESQHLLLPLLLNLMVSTHHSSAVLVHSPSMASELSVIVQGSYQGNHPTVLSWTVESFTILYPSVNYLQKP